MWRAACALISCGYTTLGRASSPDVISINLNNINDLKFYHEIRGNLPFFTVYDGLTLCMSLCCPSAAC
jgi:hypothetical protein